MSLILLILFMPNISLAEKFGWNYSNSWISSDEFIPVIIKSDDYVTKEHLNSINNVIYSNKIQIEDSEKYYFGWNIAIKDHEEITNQKIPKLEIKEEVKNVRHIVINLTSDPNIILDGHTKLYFKNDSITHAEINIYNLEQFEKRDLESLLRHEFGHALGLGHTTNPWDLMYPSISIKQDLISNFDLDRLFHNYKK